MPVVEPTGACVDAWGVLFLQLSDVLARVQAAPSVRYYATVLLHRVLAVRWAETLGASAVSVLAAVVVLASKCRHSYRPHLADRVVSAAFAVSTGVDDAALDTTTKSFMVYVTRCWEMEIVVLEALHYDLFVFDLSGVLAAKSIRDKSFQFVVDSCLHKAYCIMSVLVHHDMQAGFGWSTLTEELKFGSAMLLSLLFNDLKLPVDDVKIQFEILFGFLTTEFSDMEWVKCVNYWIDQRGANGDETIVLSFDLLDYVVSDLSSHASHYSPDHSYSHRTVSAVLQDVLLLGTSGNGNEDDDRKKHTYLSVQSVCPLSLSHRSPSSSSSSSSSSHTDVSVATLSTAEAAAHNIAHLDLQSVTMWRCPIAKVSSYEVKRDVSYKVTGSFGSGVSVIALAQLGIWQCFIRFNRKHLKDFVLTPVGVVSSIKVNDAISSSDFGSSNNHRNFYVLSRDLTTYRPINELYEESSKSFVSVDPASLLSSLWEVIGHCLRVGIVFKYLDVGSILVNNNGHLQFASFSGAVMSISLFQHQDDFQPDLPSTSTVRNANSALLMSFLSYAAPEVICGAPPSAASSVYSFGAVCIACLSGQPLVRNTSSEQKYMQHLYKVLGNVSYNVTLC